MSVVTEPTILGGSQEDYETQAMFREMGMDYWLTRTEKALEKLKG